MAHAPSLTMEAVREVVAWVESRCAQGDVANPEALLVACLKASTKRTAQPTPRFTPARHARIDWSMSQEDYERSRIAMQREMPRIRQILANRQPQPEQETRE